MTLFQPSLVSNHFKFAVKIHECSGSSGGLEIGVCDSKHPRVGERGISHLYHGQHGGVGWAWLRGYRKIYFKGGVKDNVCTCSYDMDGDVIGLEVNKPKGEILFFKNSKKVGMLVGIKEFPEKMNISAGIFYSCRLEITEFRDFQASLPDEDEIERIEYLRNPENLDSFDLTDSSKNSTVYYTKLNISGNKINNILKILLS